MSVKALSLFVTDHYPCARQAETLPHTASRLLHSVFSLEKDPEFLLYA
jgi:hypothetical protein